MVVSFDRIWAVTFADSEPKVIFVGRESGLVQKFLCSRLDTPALELRGHCGPVTGAVSPGGDDLTTCSTDGTLRFWNTAGEVEGRRDLKTVKAHQSLRCLCIGNDTIYAGADSGDVLKLEGHNVAEALTGHTDSVSAMATSDTLLFSSSYDFTVRAWDMGTSQVSFVCRGHESHVKGVCVIGTSLYTVGRDEQLYVWAIPEPGELEAAEAEEGRAEAEAGDDGDGEAALPPADAGPPQLKPVAVVGLPGLPHFAAAVGAQLVIGSSSGEICGVQTKQCAQAVADFNAGNSAKVRAAVKELNKADSIKRKNAKLRIVKQQRKAKAEMVDKNKKEAEEAAAEKAAAAPPPRGGDDDDDEEEGEEGEEPAADEPDDEEGEEESGPPLTAEQEEQLAELKEKLGEELAEATLKIATVTKAKVRALQPLKKQLFTQRKDLFVSSPFCSCFGSGQDAVTAAAIDGTTVYAGVGAQIQAITCRVGVRSLH